MLFISMFLAFLFGISLSFAVSVLYTRSTAAFAAAVVAFGGLMAGFGLFRAYPLGYILPPIGMELASTPFANDPGAVLFYFAVSALAIVLFTGFAVLLVKQEYESAKSQFDEVFSRYRSRTKFAGRFESLLAKEFVDIVRSGLLKKIGFAYVAPLLFLSFTTWYVNNGLKIPVGFNSVFYAGMVGFFGVMLYSWLTNIDLTDYYETLPVSVPTVIKAKLIAFFILSSIIGTAFVLGISILNNEVRLLWLALPVLYITGAYMVLATAYLTGLSTNSFLFDPNIMMKFTAMALIPDFGITVLSLSIDSTPLVSAVGIGFVLLFVSIFSWFFYRRLDRKWGRQAFT
jgi:MFS family permease